MIQELVWLLFKEKTLLETSITKWKKKTNYFIGFLMSSPQSNVYTEFHIIQISFILLIFFRLSQNLNFYWLLYFYFYLYLLHVYGPLLSFILHSIQFKAKKKRNENKNCHANLLISQNKMAENNLFKIIKWISRMHNVWIFFFDHNTIIFLEKKNQNLWKKYWSNDIYTVNLIDEKKSTA